MEYTTLSNGVKMPMLGFGTFQIDPAKTEEYVSQAIKKGYRSIDTAQGYLNEAGVGEAINKCGIPREELFITTKMWLPVGGYEAAQQAIDGSLEKLKTDYVDLMLIHQPFNDYYSWYRAMEDAYKAGKIRAIGVSNFMPDRFIDIANFVEIPPMVNQLEVHPFFQQKKAKEVLKKYNAQLMAYSPLAQGHNNIFTNDVLVSIGKKYNKSAAQVTLRFLIQSDVVVIPKSTREERMEENFDLFDFELTAEDMAQIEALDTGKTLFMDHYDPDTVEGFISMAKNF